MDFEALKALVADAGGWDNVVRLIFDNNIHINFVTKPEEGKLKESDFAELGGTWFYKEPAVFRDNREFDYNVNAVIYHPLDCLQSVITCKDVDKIDIMSMNDMLAQNSATG